MKEINENFSPWPLMIDMLTSILIIFVLFNFFDKLLNVNNLKNTVISLKRADFKEKFDQKFTEEVDAGKIATFADQDFLKITFSDKILFSSGSKYLKPAGKPILEKYASLIKEVQGSRDISNIQVEGHTDTDRVRDPAVGEPKDNWELSAARAISVVKFLIRENIEPSLLSANGFGQYQPVNKEANLNSQEEKELNRRIEIKIYFSAANELGINY